MLDEQPLSTDNKIAMYWRIAVVLIVFVAAIASYNVILPTFFPSVVRQNIVDPKILLRAYYNCDDDEERQKVFRMYMRYATEQNTAMALEELHSADEEHRIRAMHLLIRSNSDTCYEPLSAIYRDVSRSQAERWKAIFVLSYITKIEPAERRLLFADLGAYDESQLQLVYRECERGLDQEDKQQLIDLLEDNQLTISWQIAEIIAMVADDRETFLRLYLKYDNNNMFAYTEKRFLEYVENDIVKILQLLQRQPIKLKDEMSYLISKKIESMDEASLLRTLAAYEKLTAKCRGHLLNHLSSIQLYNASMEELIFDLLENGHGADAIDERYSYVYLLDVLSRHQAQRRLNKDLWTKGMDFERCAYVASIIQSEEAEDVALIETFIQELATLSGSRDMLNSKRVLAQRIKPLPSITNLIITDVEGHVGSDANRELYYTYLSRLTKGSDDYRHAQHLMLSSLLRWSPRAKNDGWIRASEFVTNWYPKHDVLLRLLFLVYSGAGYQHASGEEYEQQVAHLMKLPDWDAWMNYIIRQIAATSEGRGILKELQYVLSNTSQFKNSRLRNLEKEAIFKSMIEKILP